MTVKDRLDKHIGNLECMLKAHIFTQSGIDPKNVELEIKPIRYTTCNKNPVYVNEGFDYPYCTQIKPGQIPDFVKQGVGFSIQIKQNNPLYGIEDGEPEQIDLGYIFVFRLYTGEHMMSSANAPTNIIIEGGVNKTFFLIYQSLFKVFHNNPYSKIKGHFKKLLELDKKCYNFL